TSLTQLVVYRLLQGICSAGLVPLGQATLFTIYPRERHGYAMAIFSTGAMMGPIIGPTLGGWLTENFGWRWCFYINLPVGALCALGIFLFIRASRPGRRDQFDMFGFAMLTLAVGSLQLMLDRGQLKDWFHSTEIWIEATVAALLRHDGGDVYRRAADQPGRQPPVHFGRVSLNRGLALADDRVFAPHGFGADHLRRLCAGFWARLHLCAAQSARAVRIAASHP